MIQQEKEAFVQEMKGNLAKSAGVLFVDYTGLTVAEADALRKKMRDGNVGYYVVKNTLMARALAESGMEEAKAYLKGTPTGVVIGYDDPVAAAKLTFEFKKECQHVQVKGGILEKKALAPAEAEALSKMPSRLEMLGQIVGTVMNVAGQLIGQIKSPAGRVVGALEQYAEKGLDKGSENA